MPIRKMTPGRLTKWRRMARGKRKGEEVKSPRNAEATVPPRGGMEGGGEEERAGGRRAKERRRRRREAPPERAKWREDDGGR